MELQRQIQPSLKRFDRFAIAALVTNKPSGITHFRDECSKIEEIHIPKCSVHTPHFLDNVELYHDKKEFVVMHNDKRHVIDKSLMDQASRDLKKEHIRLFLMNGYFSVNQTNDGCFTLKANERLAGGGPIFGKMMYWTTKVTCYAVLAAAAGAIVFGGGGTVGVSVVKGAKGLKVLATTAEGIKAAKAVSVTVKALPVITSMTQTAATGVILEAGATATITQACGTAVFTPTVVASSMGLSGVAAAGIVKAGGAPVCAKVTGAALATGSSSGGIVAGIEWLSLSIGILCGLTPTP